MAVVLVRGTGDVGSAVAAIVHRAGHQVVLHDRAAPAHTRRGMALVDALYEGTAELEGQIAKRARTLHDLVIMLKCGQAVPVVDDSLENVIETVRPEVLVDARMRKHQQPESQRGLAPLTIGLGPNFEAGHNVDLAIETQWGEGLGRVIYEGSTLDLEGEPQAIAGHSRERYVYAPLAGVFTTQLHIGDAVMEGQEIARIGNTPIQAPLTGCLRGLTHDGATVSVRTKIVEVDPRGDPQKIYGLGLRPKRIAEGVLEAINEWAATTFVSRTPATPSAKGP